MEVAMAEEKKKIFRARKTMKLSDRQQLETVHNTLTGTTSLSNPSPPPLMNGTHKEDGQKGVDKDQNSILDSNSPNDASPVSPGSGNSPALSLSLNLSPSPPSSHSSKEKEETASTSPFHSINFELKKMEEGQGEREKKVSSPSSLNESPISAPIEAMEQDTEVITEMEEKEVAQTTIEDQALDSVEDSVEDLVPSSPVPPAASHFTEPMETDSDTSDTKNPEASTPKINAEKPSSPKASDSSPPCPSSSRPASSSGPALKQEKELKQENIKDKKDETEDVKKGLKMEKVEVKSVKSEMKKEKPEAAASGKPSRPSSTPPSDKAHPIAQEKCSTSGLKRTLSEGYEKGEQTTERDEKKPKMEGVELEAQWELKITAKASSRHKLEKIVQQLMDEQLKALERTVFDKNLQELKDRVEKIECATKHQTALNILQAKIARLAKKFGEANQMSETKRKQEALAAASAAATAAAAAAAAKTVTAAITPSAQRPVRTSMEVKQIPTTLPSSSTPVSAAQPIPTSTSTTMVQQGPILQLITSTSNSAPNLATGITTQSPTGTLLLKAAHGSNMMATGQPLLIQLPLSMANGQTGTLVNIPVSSLSAANPLNKTKTTTSTATFILKPAPVTTTATASVPAAATVPALQASPGQMNSTQISLARAVYQGGAGGISTPSAGVSVTTARTPAQSVSVAGAVSSASSPAASGPAATGSAAPGPPQGTSLTSKTDNQATGSTPTKAAAPGLRPKGSVIDLTEDDDDVQVTGVQIATVPPASATQRPQSIAIIPNSTGARSSPQSNQNSSSNPHVTVLQRPPLVSI
ncbi:hypothetical protein LDENG_00154510 [Lucifuga dentata]|nr:hypothetical protein LDENG_00154510 [Lucifuga dentata]